MKMTNRDEMYICLVNDKYCPAYKEGYCTEAKNIFDPIRCQDEMYAAEYGYDDEEDRWIG